MGDAGPRQDGHTIPILGVRRSPSITGSIRWPGTGYCINTVLSFHGDAHASTVTGGADPLAMC